MGVPQNLIFTVPVHEQQLSHNYQVRVSSDYYVVPDNVVPVSMHNCVLPFANCPHTGKELFVSRTLLFCFPFGA